MGVVSVAPCTDRARRREPGPPRHRGTGGFTRLFVATQNVDGLHAAAGSREIAELHGNIWRDRCSRCDATVDT